MLMAALDLDQRETSHFTACWQTLLLQRRSDCWMTVSAVLSGCEALTPVGGGGGGGGGEEERWRQALVIKADFPPSSPLPSLQLFPPF